MIIEHLCYFLFEIITEIQLLIFVQHQIEINFLSIQFKVLTDEQIFPLVLDYIAWKIYIREDIYDLPVKKKQEKIQYDKEKKTKYFTLSNFVLLKIFIMPLKKLRE